MICIKPQVFTESTQGYTGLSFCEAPAVLTENLFHTSKRGVRFLGSKEGAEFLAVLHADAIEEFFNTINGPKNMVSIDNIEESYNANSSTWTWTNNLLDGYHLTLGF